MCMTRVALCVLFSLVFYSLPLLCFSFFCLAFYVSVCLLSSLCLAVAAVLTRTGESRCCCLCVYLCVSVLCGFVAGAQLVNVCVGQLTGVGASQGAPTPRTMSSITRCVLAVTAFCGAQVSTQCGEGW